MEYNFYLYSRLVHRLMIDLNDWSVPYNSEFALIVDSYNEFQMKYQNTILNIDNAMTDFINDDETLYASIRELNTNTP